MYRKENMDKYRYELTIYKGENLINTIQFFNDDEEIKDFTDFVKCNYREKLLQNFTEFEVQLDSVLLNSLFKAVDKLSLDWCCYYRGDDFCKESLGLYQWQQYSTFAEATDFFADRVNKIFQSSILKNFLIETDGVLVVPGEGFFVAFGYNARFSCKKVG